MSIANSPESFRMMSSMTLIEIYVGECANVANIRINAKLREIAVQKLLSSNKLYLGISIKKSSLNSKKIIIK